MLMLGKGERFVDVDLSTGVLLSIIVSSIGSSISTSSKFDSYMFSFNFISTGINDLNCS